MKFEKADEMERFLNEKSAVYAFWFYSVALFAWTLFDLFDKGVPGIPLLILSAGHVVFFGSRVISDAKMK